MNKLKLKDMEIVVFSRHLYLLCFLFCSVVATNNSLLTLNEVNSDEVIHVQPEIPIQLSSFNCSTDEGGSLNFPDRYRLRTCAVCYSWMPDSVFKSPEAKLQYKDGKLLKIENINGTRYTRSYYAESDHLESEIYNTFSGHAGATKWASCCGSAFKCCMDMVQASVTRKKKGSECHATWDGWSCVPATPAGQYANLKCPEYTYFASNPPACQKYATKYCTKTAEWKVDKNGNTWSNYVACGPAKELLERVYVHCGAYSLSIVALIPAISIMLCHGQLQSPRIRLHKHFFISLLMNAISVMTFKLILGNHIIDSSMSLISENGIGCKVLYSLTRYFRMTNYMWMFCEGYYLHKLVAAAFAEQNSLLPLYIIGWGCPLVAVSAYSIVRAFKYDTQCWAYPVSYYEWIINGPNLLCLCINLVFLFNIIRVVWSKLRARYVNEPRHFRKTTKATLVLFPLFGIHFLLVLYRPQPDGKCIPTKVYYFIYYIVDGIQGFLVACIYCYMNSEVQTALKRSYVRFLQSLEDRKSSRRMMSSRTQSFSTNVSSSLENHSNHIKTTLIKSGKKEKGELEMIVIQEEKLSSS